MFVGLSFPVDVQPINICNHYCSPTSIGDIRNLLRLQISRREIRSTAGTQFSEPTFMVRKMYIHQLFVSDQKTNYFIVFMANAHTVFFSTGKRL